MTVHLLVTQQPKDHYGQSSIFGLVLSILCVAATCIRSSARPTVCTVNLNFKYRFRFTQPFAYRHTAKDM